MRGSAAEPARRVSGLRIGRDASGTVLRFSGRLDAAGIAPLWAEVHRAADAARGAPITFDLDGVERCDTAGAAMILSAERRHGGHAVLRASREVGALLDRLRAAPVPPPAVPAPFSLGAVARGWLRGAGDLVAGVGGAATTLARLPARRRMLRGRELVGIADAAGVRAVPLLAMLGFVTGVILAFQSSLQLSRFGAQIYVANLVTVSLLRELGPLFGAFMLAGRTGSAFAAELASMKVNQELDALRTMGLDPGTLLVVPRVAAAVIVMPGLTLVMEIAGLVGMAVVMGGLGFPPAAVLAQVTRMDRLRDLFGGLFKAECFAVAVAVIGCRAGLTAGAEPREVGRAATRAVVGGIAGSVLLDGLFAALFYRLGL